ncbi:MAG: fibrobacter succinogenes major paralogous domain-containing protein, partial [Rikenellaceae bacterium]|nr:fibrobacter succinogenes major paralogous domain-containing protein [Rikenellaceae bacterium]
MKGSTDAPTDPDAPDDPDNPDTEPPVKYETVNIGGTEWMLYNLANPKQAEDGATFATKLPSECDDGTRLESHGKFYQWGINVAWNSIGDAASGATPSGSWQTSTSYPSDWNTHPCPDGYRLPTYTEFQSLENSSTVSRGGGWSSSDYGYIKFTSGSNSVEFPAVGYRNTDGSLNSRVGASGTYWSSVANGSNYAYILGFGSSYLCVDGDDKQGGLSVRCVKGNSDPNPVDPDKKIDPFSTIKIGGTEWMPLNLANPKQASGGATFATKLPSQCDDIRAESHGKFYQWGINVAWNTTGDAVSGATPSESWNMSTYPADWNTHPCPEGYRLPAKDEFRALINSSTVSRGGGWSSSDYGYI